MTTESMGRMGPINATVRLVCEMVAVYGITAGVWVWTDSTVAAIFAPAAAMVIWGVFRVPDDPGSAPIAVPGLVRLAIEIIVFGVGTAGISAAIGGRVGIAYVAVVVIHYATTPRRLRHLLMAPHLG